MSFMESAGLVVVPARDLAGIKQAMQATTAMDLTTAKLIFFINEHQRLGNSPGFSPVFQKAPESAKVNRDIPTRMRQ
jgi:hypothetical protein